MRGDREPIYLRVALLTISSAVPHSSLVRTCMRDLRLHVECRCRDGLFGRGRMAAELRVRLSASGRLRSGTHAISSVPDGYELERETLNRYLTGLSYSPTANWDFDLRVPYVIRTHSTYGDFDSTQPLERVELFAQLEPGRRPPDRQLSGDAADAQPRVQLGVKLPTGKYGTADRLLWGANAGTPLDASLQPGTGSTDIIVGAYYYRAISQDFDLTVNGQFQSAVRHHMDQPGNDYRPGNSTTSQLRVAL